MGKKVRLLGLVALLTLIIKSVCWADPITLLKMSCDNQENLTRISFFFDRIPEFEVENSGQRIRLITPQTNLSPSFIPLSSDQVIFDVKYFQNIQDSIVDIYLRNLPKFVDITVDRKYLRLVANIFWDQQRLGGRPAILDKKLGELKPLKGGAAAQQIISSNYSGRWLEFFNEFDSPVELLLPIHFSFPPFPGPMVVENSTYLAIDLLQEEFQEKEEKLCNQAEEKLTTSSPESNESWKTDLFKLIKAECLMRKRDYKAALQVLEQPDFSEDEILDSWIRFYRSFALIASGNHYRTIDLTHEQEERLLEIKNFEPWYRIFQAEVELAKGNPERAFFILDKEIESDELVSGIKSLRKADSLFELDQSYNAFDLYNQAGPDLIMLQQHPESMAKWAELLYANNDFSSAYKYYLLLSEILKDTFPKQKALADFRSAMAILKVEGTVPARLLLSNVNEKYPGTEAGFRSWMKLMDLDLLNDSKPVLNDILEGYDYIIEFGPTRMLREEAFFKKIIVCHLYGKNLKAIKFLGRFFEDFWAGELLPEAQALFVEIFPQAIQELMDEKNSFVALSLVAKHRELLAQAHITYDFLNDLAEHYFQTGFLEQAENTYLYMLDFEKSKDKKKEIFLSLIRICYQQDKYDQVEHYASRYLEEYPGDSEKGNILYYYADVLLKKGDLQTVVGLLLDKNRPRNKELDHLAGEIFLKMQQFDLAEHYLAEAIAGEKDKASPDIILQRAEALFGAKNYEKAIDFYETLLDIPEFSGQAGYRLIQIWLHQGQNERALKLYSKLTESKIEKHWMELAAETVQIKQYINRNR